MWLERLDLNAPFVACMVLCATSCTNPPTATPPIEEGFQQEPASPIPPTPQGAEIEPASDVSILIKAIQRLSEHGIDTSAYDLTGIEALTSTPEAQKDAIAKAWQLAATHLAHGYLDQETLAPRTEPGIAEINMYAALMQGGDAETLAAALSTLAPQHPTYLALRRELTRQRVAISEETAPEAIARHSAWIDQLRVNLERWRWLPHNLGERSVLANIAGFDVTTFEEETPTSRYAAIFGKTQRQTPIFSDKIEYIIFNPWWEVPDSIARQDKLPQFRRDPGSIARFGYQVLDRQGNVLDPATIDWNSVSPASFPYRIRQAPGPQNALGQVKIMFPNPHNVYLHDTNDRSLFDAEQRTFSSGCVRVQNPLDLAAWILEDTPGWDRASIDTVVSSGKETRVDLPQPVPVYVVYMTAVSDSCGAVTYLQDIYTRDKAILDALQPSLSE